MNVLLYFGSFNPIHNGHIGLALHLMENYNFDEIWFVVSPQNPLKQKSSLWRDDIRYNLAKEALSKYNNFYVSDIEFNLPQPNYTVNTLRKLSELHNDKNFALLIGEDNLKIFDKWFDYQYIIDNYSIYVYPRGAENKEEGYYQYKNIIRIKAPLFNISSTIIRDKLRTGKSISGLVPQNIEQEIYNYYNKGLIIV